MANFGKAPEKLNFAQTCNLLSQYLKERGNLGDISRGINGKLESKGPETPRPPATTLNLLPNMESSGETSRTNSATALTNVKSMDFFPQFVGFDSTAETTGKVDSRKSSSADTKTAQMSIFYAGKVIVFDDFPADKAKEIMALASKGGSYGTSAFFSTNASQQDKFKSTKSVTNDSNNAQESLELRPLVNVSDLPIVRKNSLHRFLTRRKDRVAARAPYQIHNPSSPCPPKPEESDSLFDLEAGPSSKQLDLNL